MNFIYKVSPERLDYTGEQLSPHFNYSKFDLIGNSAVAFRGKMQVREKMLDIEDTKRELFIHSDDAVNFIFEFFDRTFYETILLQRLFVRIVQTYLQLQRIEKSFLVRGNDLYCTDALKVKVRQDELLKMSVSIATASPLSTLIHYGINVSSKNTPLPTLGLEDLQINPIQFSEDVLRLFEGEYLALDKARSKVHPVY